MILGIKSQKWWRLPRDQWKSNRKTECEPHAGSPIITADSFCWEIAVFVINAQLNLTWSSQIPCKVTDYCAQLVHIGCAAVASRVSLLRCIPCSMTAFMRFASSLSAPDGATERGGERGALKAHSANFTVWLHQNDHWHFVITQRRKESGDSICRCIHQRIYYLLISNTWHQRRTRDSVSM